MNRRILISLSILLLLALASVAVLVLWPMPEAPEKEPDRPVSTPSREAAPAAPQPPESPSAPPAPTPLATPPPLTDWEQRLDTILTAPGDTSTASRALLAAMPGLPAEAQEQYIAHALNLCEDADFPRAEEIYLNSATPPSVAEAIFNDSLNRPDEVKLPLMAKTMNSPSHPMREEAQGILELYLELETGAAPPGSWDIAVREYLKNQQEP
jgi:hypothetical protein